MMRNTIFEHKEEQKVDKFRNLYKEDTNFFKFDGSPSADVIKEVSHPYSC